MNKRDLSILERAFAAEVDAAMAGHGLPFQTKGKRVAELAVEGYLRRVDVVIPGRFPVTVSGYELTHQGRLAYCMTCDGEP